METVLYRHRRSPEGYRPGMDSSNGSAFIEMSRLDQRTLRAIDPVHRIGQIKDIRRKEAYRLKLGTGMIMGFRTPRMGVDNLAGNALVSMEKEIRGRKEKCEQHKQNDTADPWKPLTHRVQRYKNQGNIYQLARLKIL